jgi:transposase InsO family protein
MMITEVIIMPWKETDIMDQKEQFIHQMLKTEKPFKHLCEEFGISEKTGYKWRQRFYTEGKAGLTERSRMPKNSSERLPENVVIDLIQLKYAHPSWGPKKILAIYQKQHRISPSLSSVKRILTRAKLVNPRRVRKVEISSERLRQRILPGACNDVWAIDFKGWWRSGGEVCEPLTVRDLHSRFILEVRLMESKTSQAVRAVLTELFRKYGLPKVIRTDNGTPFASTHGVLTLTNLSAWWITLGVIPDRIEKGKPGQNGSLERMHADIANEIERKISGGRLENQIALDAWREEYNHLRPNEAIGMRTPSELYIPSPLKYVGDPDALEYPPGFLPRKVASNGLISIHDLDISIGSSLSGLIIGLKPTVSGKYHVFLADFFLGELDVNLSCFTPCNQLESN